MKQNLVFFSIALSFEITCDMMLSLSFVSMLFVALVYERIGFWKALQIYLISSFLAILRYINVLFWSSTAGRVGLATFVGVMVASVFAVLMLTICLNKILKRFFKRLYNRVTNIPVR